MGGDVHAHGVARRKGVVECLEHLDEQRVGLDPGVGIGGLVVGIDGLLDLCSLAPLDRGERVGELDPERVVYRECRLVAAACRPGVARDGIKSAVRGKGRVARKVYGQPLAFLGVAHDAHGVGLLGGKRGRVPQVQRVALDFGHEDRRGIAREAYGNVLLAERLAEHVVGRDERRKVLVAHAVVVHYVGRYDDGGALLEGVADEEDSAHVMHGVGTQAGERRVRKAVGLALVGEGFRRECEAGIGGELFEGEPAERICCGGECFGGDVHEGRVLVREAQLYLGGGRLYARGFFLHIEFARDSRVQRRKPHDARPARHHAFHVARFARGCHRDNLGGVVKRVLLVNRVVAEREGVLAVG